MPSSGFQTCALRSEEHTSELQSHDNLVCRLLLDNNDRFARTPTSNVPAQTVTVAAQDGMSRGVARVVVKRRAPRAVRAPDGPGPCIVFVNQAAPPGAPLSPTPPLLPS